VQPGLEPLVEPVLGPGQIDVADAELLEAEFGGAASELGLQVPEFRGVRLLAHSGPLP
jgi:hypothetical protein